MSFSVACSLAEAQGLQKEKFRGGNVTKVGIHCLLLGGKQADNLENFCAVKNWACLLLLISCTQVCGNPSGLGLGGLQGSGVDFDTLGKGSWTPGCAVSWPPGRFCDISLEGWF